MSSDHFDNLSSGRSENLSGCCADERRHKFKRQSIWDQRFALKHFTSHGYTSEQLKEIWSQLIKNNCDLNSVKTSDDIKELLRESFALNTIRLITQIVSDDGNTKRLMLELQDGHTIEAVIIKYGLYSTGNKNIPMNSTLCLSCQVGNNMDCTFCANGTDGLFANLTSGEILEQLQIANSIEKISRIAFMGMGEPLDNYKEVIASIRAMTDPNQFGLDPNNITISSVGIPDRIQTLSVDVPGVSLSLAIHSANQDTRENLIPSAMMFPLTEIFKSLDEYLKNHSKLVDSGKANRVIIEYVLIDGINDSQKDAKDLVNLIIPRKDYCIINPSLFIPPTKTPSKFRSPSLDSLLEFISVIRAHNLSIVPKYANINKLSNNARVSPVNHDSSVQYELLNPPQGIGFDKLDPSTLINMKYDGNILKHDINAVHRNKDQFNEDAESNITPSMASSIEKTLVFSENNTENNTENPLPDSFFNNINAHFNTIKSTISDYFSSLTSKAKTVTSKDMKEYLLELKRNSCPRDCVNELMERIGNRYKELKNNIQFIKDFDDYWDENIKHKCNFCEKFGITTPHAVIATTAVMATTIGIILLYKTKRR